MVAEALWALWEFGIGRAAGQVLGALFLGIGWLASWAEGSVGRYEQGMTTGMVFIS